jgi:hypothetical protein
MSLSRPVRVASGLLVAANRQLIVQPKNRVNRQRIAHLNGR